MTESTRLFRAGIFAGVLLSTAAVLVVPTAVAQQAPVMPRPRYQSPGVSPQVEAPSPQYRMPQTQAITPNATVVEDVIVRVNDQIISRSDLERSEAQLQQELAQNPNAGDSGDRQKNLLRDLIDQQLLLSKGKELGVNADAEVVRRLDEIRKQNNFKTMEELESAARGQGVSFEDFKASIRNNIITGNVVRDEVGRTVQQHMSESEQRKYYEAHKTEMQQPEQVRLSEILVPLAANADEAQVADAQKTSQAIYDKLKGGADFAATAKAQSGGPTAAQGGDLGQFKHGALAAVLEQKTFALPVGGFTEPTRTRQGFVILKATEHQQAGTPPFEQVQGEIQNVMYQDQIQPALRAYLTKLREDSFVDIRPGFVDSGASARQTKPVFAAYVAPTPKKKEVKKRMDANSGRMEQRKATAAPAVAVLDKNGKPKKVKREKVRFGQAPRTALPDAPDDSTTVAAAAPGNPAAAGAASPDKAAAPGTAVSPLETNNTVAANASDEADALPTTPHAKTRYQNRVVEVKQRNEAKKQASIFDRKKATPIAADPTEKQEQTLQSTALGLNGSDAKKARRKRQKGELKERLQDKPVQKAAPLQDNGLPDRLHQVNSPKKQTSDTTTLAPADQPAPGSTTPSATPSSNGAATPTSNQPVPQTSTQPQ